MITLVVLYTNLRREIVCLSGLTEDRLDEAALELSLHYENWCMDYAEDHGPPLEDYFAGFQEMLGYYPLPWPRIDGMNYCSALSGLTIAQFYLVSAYDVIESALSITTGQSMRDGRRFEGGTPDHAAVFAAMATKLLMFAKHMISTNTDSLAQEAWLPVLIAPTTA